MEVDIAPGDSGGPTFLNGQIVGVHSFGATGGTAWGDINGVLDSTYGEFFGDTRVSLYADWIDDYHNPEPATMLLSASALLLLAWKARRPSR